MKRLFLGLMFVFLTSILFACESEESVSFADDNLEEAVRSEIDQSDDDIFTSDLEDIKELDLSDSEISDVGGIEALENIEILSLENNDISDFTPLADLNKLEEVTVIGNPSLNNDEQNKLLEELTGDGVAVEDTLGEPDGPGGFLWKVENGDTTVYLQGTIHIGKEDFFPMNEKIEAAYMESDIIVPEVDLNNVSIAETQEITQDLGMYDDGTDVSDHISSDLYADLEETLGELDLPLQIVKDFQPWLLANTIQQLMGEKIGYIDGVDEYFLNRAEDDEKEVIGLETVEDQLSIFADLSPEMQEAQLEEALMDIDQYEDQMDELLSLYMEGNVDELLDYLLMDEGMEETDDEDVSDEEKAFMEALNDDRNMGMADQIADFLEEDSNATYFVIVGTLHLTQEPHVRSILEKEGYDIEQVL